MKKRGAEKYTGQDGHFAHRRLPPSAVPDALHNVEGLLIDDRLVGILENLPLGRIVSYGLFAFEGLLVRPEIHRVSKILRFHQHVVIRQII